jgi:hypothetical protein
MLMETLRVIILNLLTTASDASEIYLTDLGMEMNGTVKVSAPTSAATVAVFYG